jgi:HAD superfamily hydrolase (TIGR01509 family)
MGPRAFLFDLDGTLVDSERECAESIERVLARRGRRLKDEERDFVMVHGWPETHARLAAAGGVDLSFEALKDAAAAERERMGEEKGLRVLPGAVAFVRRAAAHGPCAIVSGSTRREIAWCIDRLGLAGVLRGFVGAEDVERGKPAPDGYLAGAARLGVAPPACVAFEDSRFGIAAAKAAGMRVVALAAGNSLGHDQGQADLRVTSFEALGDSLWAEV